MYHDDNEKPKYLQSPYKELEFMTEDKNKIRTPIIETFFSNDKEDMSLTQNSKGYRLRRMVISNEGENSSILLEPNFVHCNKFNENEVESVTPGKCREDNVTKKSQSETDSTENSIYTKPYFLLDGQGINYNYKSYFAYMESETYGKVNTLVTLLNKI